MYYINYSNIMLFTIGAYQKDLKPSENCLIEYDLF